MAVTPEERRAELARARERRSVELIEREALSPGVARFRFALREGEALHHAPGQYVNVYLPGAEGEELSRSYSLAAGPAPGGDVFELGVTRVEGGAGSTALHGLEVGDRVVVDGPWGVFTHERAPADAPRLYVATGTGLTPIRAMLERDLATVGGPPITLLFGCRRAEDQLWQDQWEAAAARDPRFRYEVTLSRPDAAWEGRSGYVQTHLDEVLGRLEGTPHAFICGMRRMIDAVRGQLKEAHGFDRKRIHTERYD
ncbi:MAG: FAD-dependent oxidoreductase [Myxococcota bacterium]